jgi:S-adenosylmethionine hydrolase
MPRSPSPRPAARKRRPLVALLTDFGTRDHYAGAVRGAVLAACPEATVVDITHDLPRHDVAAGAYSLAAAYRAFPPGAVFLAVVDPGVGSARRAIALDAGGYRFVGPDNGIFTHVLAEHPGARVRAITNPRLVRPDVSNTFHARGRLRPRGRPPGPGAGLSEVGPAVRDPVTLAQEAVRRVGKSEWEAAVVDVDGFGNLTTNLSGTELAAILNTLDGDPTRVVVVVEGVVLPLVRTYADVAEGEPCALLGSGGRLEIAVHRDSAARLLGAPRGAPVRLRVAVARGGAHA